jgi:AraC family transcriptional regulator, transcriptional activator of pobA
LKKITTIPDYCKEVNIPQPRYSFFDVRRFEDKAKTENAKQPPFRHEFYAIALRHTGGNKEVNGTLLQANLFFNSPYQVVSWDILPDWKGWYIMFGQEFLTLNPAWKNFIVDFPFFRLDKSIPFDLPPADVILADNLFEKISEEYHSDNNDKFDFILSYTSLLLLLTKRYFQEPNIAELPQINRTADIMLLSRFQSMVETWIAREDAGPEIRLPSFYAGKLNVHLNHLNAIVKRITGKTATALIGNYLIASAKSLLRQTSFSVKEVAFKLHFKKPTHFTAFFKKATGVTPQQYRESAIL